MRGRRGRARHWRRRPGQGEGVGETEEGGVGDHAERDDVKTDVERHGVARALPSVLTDHASCDEDRAPQTSGVIVLRRANQKTTRGACSGSRPRLMRACPATDMLMTSVSALSSSSKTPLPLRSATLSMPLTRWLWSEADLESRYGGSARCRCTRSWLCFVVQNASDDGVELSCRASSARS